MIAPKAGASLTGQVLYQFGIKASAANLAFARGSHRAPENRMNGEHVHATQGICMVLADATQRYRLISWQGARNE